MDHAIIVAGGRGIDGVDLSGFPTKQLVGVPQLNRLIIVAQRAGISNFTIITDYDNYHALDNVESDKRIDASISWHKKGEKISLEDSHYLVLQSNLVITPESLKNLINEKINKNDFLILVDKTDNPSLTLSNGKVEGSFTTSGVAIGAFVSSGRELKKTINSPDSL
ncbi:MAG: hypothetical protein GTN99_03115, partial [Candidatus Dadabacteria bacterium]|nr:hypothetical protein [Candidatus Dadabacteria bacterium]